MFRAFLALSALICNFFLFSLINAECCQSLELDAGWRRDSLDWKTKDLRSSYIRGHSDSRILFKDIDSYTLTARAKWSDTSYYIRATAEYGLSEKGRAHERFHIKSPTLHYPITVHANDPIKRRSEVYDFNIAAGYPLSFCCSRLSVIPLIGFSFHRQHLRVKADKIHHSSCSSSSSLSCCEKAAAAAAGTTTTDATTLLQSSSSLSSSFSVRSSNPFKHSSRSSNPFSSSSHDNEYNIPYELGLSNGHRTSSYRFTWYGFYLGADIAYALDSCWTIFTELEGHFLDQCHRKRKSWTGVSYVDDYHHEGWAYGFNGVFGLTYAFNTCWYSTISVDYNWWNSQNKHDQLKWKTVGAKIGVGYMF